MSTVSAMLLFIVCAELLGECVCLLADGCETPVATAGIAVASFCVQNKDWCLL